MAPTLPRELVSLVIRELFLEAKDYQTADVAAFQQLRLVAHQAKEDAHHAWPSGLALLADEGCRKLLRYSVTGAAFRQGLDDARLVLQETKSLSLFLPPRSEDGVGSDPRRKLFGRVKQITSSTQSLDKLLLSCSGASLALRKLPLAHLRLKELHLRNVAQNSTVGLDLSGMHTLDTLEIAQSTDYAAVLTKFRLPPRASVIKLQWMSLSLDQVEALGLGRITGLRALDLSGSRIDRPLPAMPALRELHVRNVRVDNDHVLASWSTLEKLSVAGTSISSVAPLALATNTSLKCLDVSHTHIQDAATFALETNTGLHELRARRCDFTSLAFGLPSNKTLQELSLRFCSFTVPLMQQLVGELAGNSTLSKLDLSACFITDELMSNFTLDKASGVEELNLEGNDFSDEGLRPLVDSIMEHGLLRKLDISHCVGVTEVFAARLRTAGGC